MSDGGESDVRAAMDVFFVTRSNRKRARNRSNARAKKTLARRCAMLTRKKARRRVRSARRGALTSRPRRVSARAPPRTVVQDVWLDARLPSAPAQVHERPESRLLGRRGAAAAEAAIVFAHEEAHCDCLGRPDDARCARRAADARGMPRADCACNLSSLGRRERDV